MNVIVIYPGRFHPFHRGHKASYDYLAQRFGDNSVYVTTSDIQAPVTSPFTFADKVEQMTALGVPASHVVKVKQPYQPQEITDNLSAEEKATTALIFAVSEKDMAEGSARFKFGVKKNGEPTYLQPMPENVKQLQPMTKHAYVLVTPTVNFRVQGADANSASQIRQRYIKGSDADRDTIIADLYGEVIPAIRDTFDRRLGVTERVQEFVYGTPIVDAGLKEPGVREHRQRVGRLLEQVMRLERRVNTSHQPLQEDLREDYIEEKWSQQYKRSINCNNPRGFSQRAHCAGRKKK